MTLTVLVRCGSHQPPALLLARRHTTRQVIFQFRVLRTSAHPERYHTARSPFCLRNATLPTAFSSNALLPSLPLTAVSPSMATQTTSQTRNLAGHGHGHHHHHHHHDNTYLLSQNKKDAGVRITRLGLLVNLSMAIGKFIGGYVFHSQALVADAYHALTDLVSDFMTLGTVAWSLKPPTGRFPYGYGKVESLGALGVSSLLLCGGVFMGLNAGQVLLAQFLPDVFEALEQAGLLVHGHSHGHGHGGETIGPNINAAWLAGGSIIVKEWLYRATMKIARERKSSVLASNAVHHRVDSLTSAVALATIGGSHLITDASWLDPVGGLIISLMVIRAGWNNTGAALLELADTTVDEEIKESVRATASKALATTPAGSDAKVREVQGMKSGQNYLMEVELAVPGSWDVYRSRRVEETLREAVGSRVRGVRRVKVRFVPDELKEVDFREEFIPGDVCPRGSPEPEEPELNHSHHVNGHAHSHEQENPLHKRR